MKKPTKKAVIAEISAIAFSDLAKYVTVDTDENGCKVMTVTDTSLLKNDARKAVCSVKTGTKGIEIKLYDKLRALELLGRMHGIFSSGGSEEKDALDELRSIFGRECDDDTD